MRAHDVMGVSREKWLAQLYELDDSTADLASRRATDQIKQGRLAKKRADIMKAQRQLEKKKQDLANAFRK